MFGCWKNGVRQGKFTTSYLEKGIRLLQGNYKAGKLIGVGSIEFDDGEILEGQFRDGCLHGLVRRIGARRNLLSVGRYSSGIPEGTFWEFFPGGGCIRGQVNSQGSISDENGVYIYPDWVNCSVGIIENSLVMKSKEARIIAAGIFKVNFILCQLKILCQILIFSRESWMFKQPL